VLFKTSPIFPNSVVPKPRARTTPVFYGLSQSVPIPNRSDGHLSQFAATIKQQIQYLFHFTFLLATLYMEVVRLTGSLQKTVQY